MKPGIVAAVLAVSLLLSACAGLPTQYASDLDWSDRVAQLNALKTWRASGKLAIRTQEQSESVNLQWQQDNHTTHIVLSGPLGIGATSIESDMQQLSVTRDGHTEHYDISSARAARDAFGLDLPLQALPYWIMGLPAPGLQSNNDPLIERGLLRRQEQLGWTITYESYGQFGHYTLPTRLKIERQSTRARLILRNWSDFSS